MNTRKRRQKARKQRQRDFGLLEMMKCFYVLLNTVGGTMTVTKEVLLSLPSDWKERIKIDNIESLGAYRISILKKDEPVGIITPSKRIIIAN